MCAMLWSMSFMSNEKSAFLSYETRSYQINSCVLTLEHHIEAFVGNNFSVGAV